MRSSMIAVVGAVLLAVTGCAAPEGDAAPAESASPSPAAEGGGAAHLPPPSEACDFLVGEQGRDFAAFSGGDLSGLTVVEDVEAIFPPGGDHFLARLVDRDAYICLMEPPHAGEFVVFAWVPIEESQREAIIDDLAGNGLERRESEGGTAFVEPGEPTFESHLVTNAGWYYSTQERGAVYLRTLFED